MDSGQPLGRLAAHGVGDGGARVAALGDIAAVSEAAHQLRPGSGDAADAPAGLGRLGGQAVAVQGQEFRSGCEGPAAGLCGLVVAGWREGQFPVKSWSMISAPVVMTGRSSRR